MSGKLYIVATPIGNLDDVTFRAVEVLRNVDKIVTEDTRRTKKLLSHYDIHTPMLAYHEHNEMAKAPSIVKMLQSGSDVALVSEAGTPVISDPGYRLISLAVEEEIVVVPIPGPSASIAALSASGLPSDRFLFVGFLPDKQGKRLKKLEELACEKATIIFYISKWKLQKVLVDMLEVLGDRRVCFCRELTKIHEDVRHTMLSELVTSCADIQLKGEITLVVGGSV